MVSHSDKKGRRMQQRAQGGRLPGCSRPKPPKTKNLKITDFADIISKVLRDLPLRRNQTPKSADY
jgi:hypothetical protein